MYKMQFYKFYILYSEESDKFSESYYSFRHLGSIPQVFEV